MVNDLAVTKVKLCDLLHILIGKSEIPDVDILLHTLNMNGLWQNGNAALRFPFEGYLSGGLGSTAKIVKNNAIFYAAKAY